MKRALSFLLVLVMVLAMAACGETKEADVVENVDPENNSVVIETPPAIVSGPDTPVENYPTVEALPTTVPTANPNPQATTVPGPAATPGLPVVDGTEGGTESPTDPAPATTEDHPEITFADDSGEMYYPTATDWEKQNAKQAYTNVLHANFRVGPGTQYKIYESLPLYADVRVISIDGNWAKIWYDGYMLGYVHKNFITFGTPPKTLSL